ncbi:MAG: hypothetical protein LBT97_10355 [Planctomycetota bacterium]|jgi:hypothetical protein|nr:hypothetical protein [Planctomycetota bacterium]
MSEQGNVSSGSRLGGFFAWLTQSIQRPGWRRWTILAAAALLFIILLAFLRDRIDYRRDPSALVPKGVSAFVETRRLDDLLEKAGEWPLWGDERRVSGAGQWSHLQALLAELIGGKVHGLGSQLPLSWFAGARRAAVAWIEGGDGLPATWALYLDVPNAVGALGELRNEPGVTATPYEGRPHFFSVSGPDRRSLAVRAFDLWLIVSTDPELPLFAGESRGRAGQSLAATGILPEWRNEFSVRGIVNPRVLVRLFPESAIASTSGWMRDDMRRVFAANIDREGGVDIKSRYAPVAAAAGGNMIWSFLKLALWLVAVLCLLLVAAILLVMLGWSGWLKALALRAGIAAADAPAAVAPSAAFREDAGVSRDAAAPAGTDEAETMLRGSGREDAPAEDAAPAEADASGRDAVSDLDGEPMETFPEIPGDSPDPEAGRLPAGDSAPKEVVDGVKPKPAAKSAVKPRPAGRSAPRKKEPDGAGDDAGRETEAMPKPKRKPSRRKSKA